MSAYRKLDAKGGANMRRVILSAFAAGLAGCSNPSPSSNPDTKSLVSAPAATPSVVAPIEEDQCDEWLGASTKDVSITTLFNQIKKGSSGNRVGDFGGS